MVVGGDYNFFEAIEGGGSRPIDLIADDPGLRVYIIKQYLIHAVA
jgi:hypothetical protein